MKLLPVLCRVLLGLLFLVFGLNGLHPFMPVPAMPVGTPMSDWVHIMTVSHWQQAVSAMMALGGLLLLIGGTVPLGLCLLCPITFNILCFHVFLTGGTGIGMGAFTAIVELLLIYFYRANFAGILTAQAKPGTQPTPSAPSGL